MKQSRYFLWAVVGTILGHLVMLLIGSANFDATAGMLVGIAATCWFNRKNTV